MVYVNRDYKKDCMLERNRFLVEHSDILLAVYNGERRGGTAATIRYARKAGREVWIMDPETHLVTREDGICQTQGKGRFPFARDLCYNKIHNSRSSTSAG